MKMGHDCEIFLRDATTGEYVPSCGLIGGTKAEPLPFGVGFIQEDNVCVEFNIKPAIKKLDFVVDTISMLSAIEERVKSLGLVIEKSSSALFSPSSLTSPQARMFGCESDYNAWTLEKNPIADPFTIGGLRTSGGHLHIDVPDVLINPMLGIDVVRALDMTVGVASVLLDKDRTRRTLYGRAGAYRPKSYGIEYRVLGNFWLADASVMEWLWDSVKWTLGHLSDLRNKQDISSHVVHCINTYDQAEAVSILRHIKFPPSLFKTSL